MGETTFAVLDIVLLAIAAITAIATVQVRSLFAATMLSGFYSLIMALVWQNLDAVDVSFTEAAVGAGISTILLLGALVFTGFEEKPARQAVNGPALLIVCVTGLALAYGTRDMPYYGDPEAPVHRLHNYVTQRIGQALPIEGRVGPDGKRTDGYREDWVGRPDSEIWRSPGALEAAAGPRTPQATDAHGHGPYPDDDWDGHVPNTATSLLAGYRGFDTMFETAVIFTAGMALVLLLRRRRDQDDDRTADERRGSEGRLPAAGKN